MSRDSREEMLKRIRTGLYGSAKAQRRGDELLSEKADSEIVKRKEVRYPHELEPDNQILISQLIEGITKASGKAELLQSEGAVKDFILTLIEEHDYSSFAIWESELLRRLNLCELLQNMRLKFASPSSKEEMARADVGITEVDFAIADTGTIVLTSSEKQPRSVSLIPPIHIAVLRSDKIFKNIHDLFAFLSDSIAGMGSSMDPQIPSLSIATSDPVVPQNPSLRIATSDPGELTSCMTFITGPSRTADIELTLTLGVHGPRELFVLIYS